MLKTIILRAGGATHPESTACRLDSSGTMHPSMWPVLVVMRTKKLTEETSPEVEGEYGSEQVQVIAADAGLIHRADQQRDACAGVRKVLL